MAIEQTDSFSAVRRNGNHFHIALFSDLPRDRFTNQRMVVYHVDSAAIFLRV